MKRFAVTAFVLLALVVSAVLIAPLRTKAKSKPIWQLSQAAQVQLGVRDKYGELGSYTAKFVVTNRKGKASSALKQVSDDGWAFVYFPEDFETWHEAGKYTWKCYVGGSPVTGGSFELTQNGLKISEKVKFY